MFVLGRVLLPLFVGAWLLLTACLTAHSQSENTKVVQLRCEVFCSRDRLRTANARLNWVGKGMPLGPAKFATTPISRVKEVVETTVYKNGFKKNRFAVLPTNQPGIRSKSFAAQRAGETSLRALDLKVVGINRPDPEIRARSRAQLMTEPRTQETSIVIEGLEPGVNYFWRIRFSGPDGRETSGIARCVAPVCPADQKK